MKKIIFPLLLIVSVCVSSWSSVQASYTLDPEEKEMMSLLDSKLESMLTDNKAGLITFMMQMNQLIARWSSDERTMALATQLFNSSVGLLSSTVDLSLESISIACRGECLRIFVCGQWPLEDVSPREVQLKTILNNIVKTQWVDITGLGKRCAWVDYHMKNDFAINLTDSYTLSSYVDANDELKEIREHNNGYSWSIPLSPGSSKEYNIIVR